MGGLLDLQCCLRTRIPFLLVVILPVKQVSSNTQEQSGTHSQHNHYRHSRQDPTPTVRSGMTPCRGFRVCFPAVFRNRFQQLPLQLRYTVEAVSGANRHSLFQCTALPLRDSGNRIPVHILLFHHPGKRVHRYFSRQAIVECCAQGVYIRPGSQIASAAILLQRSKALLQNSLGGFGQILLHISAERIPHRAKIQELDASSLIQHNIVRTDIPVDQPTLVDGFQRIHNGTENGQSLLHCKLSALPGNIMQQIHAADILHDDIRRVVLLKETSETHNLFHIVKFAERFRLPEEPVLAVGIYRCGSLHTALHPAAAGVIPGDQAAGIVFLDCHRNIQIPVPTHIGDAEPTLAQSFANQVFPIQNCSHRQLMGGVLRSLPKAAIFTDLPGIFQPHTAKTQLLRHLFHSLSANQSSNSFRQGFPFTV